MDRPFREVHELYKILYQRAEAQKAAEDKRKKEEEAKKRAADSNRMMPMPPRPYRSTDVSNNQEVISQPSPLEAEALEEAFEDLI